jgi:dTDP-4-amino-4,6-dideoxygalactose transaminase
MTQNPTVPFVDLISMHRALESELTEVFKSALRAAAFVGGPEVDGFEREFAEFCGAKFCVAVNSGTDALRFALMAVGIGPGDIVLTVPNTFIATTEAISQSGAQPDFIDIDERSFTMDPEKLREYLEAQCFVDGTTGRCVHRTLAKPVAGVIPVHLYGQMADMDPIMKLAARYKLSVIEDACQAHGAEYFSRSQNKWLKAGSMGHASAFSFYPGKNLGACGEGGAVTTNDPEISRKVSMLRDHGQSKKYHHDLEGYNGRMDSVQAGLLRVKLRYLAQWNQQRYESARIYNELFAPIADLVVPPHQAARSKSVYHLYVVRTPNRDELLKHLTSAGIGTGIHYPIPVHLQAAYAASGWKRGDFPESEKAADQILSLPMFAGLTPSQQERVAEAVSQFAASCTTR